jgi:hypothetical protein
MILDEARKLASNSAVFSGITFNIATSRIIVLIRYLVQSKAHAAFDVINGKCVKQY